MKLLLLIFCVRCMRIGLFAPDPFGLRVRALGAAMFASSDVALAVSVVVVSSWFRLSLPIWSAPKGGSCCCTRYLVLVGVLQLLAGTVAFWSYLAGCLVRVPAWCLVKLLCCVSVISGTGAGMSGSALCSFD